MPKVKTVSTKDGFKPQHQQPYLPYISWKMRNAQFPAPRDITPESPKENGQRDLLKSAFNNSQNIIVISGAGISTKAGIADFRGSSRTKGSSRQVFHISAYSLEQSTARLHDTMYHMFTAAEKSEPTAFHHYMNRLAASGRLRRHYTQIIDCLEARLPLLSQKTKWLHGWLDRMICQRCQAVVPTSPGSFQQQVLSSCVKCEAADRERLEAGKRSRGVGLLLPKVLLYGGNSPDESDIADSFEKDLNEPVDAVIIVGTRLRILSLRRFAKRLCEAVKARGGVTLWVSDEPSKLGPKFQSVIDFEVLSDCDMFPSFTDSGC